MSGYAEEYARSIADREGFWAEQARSIDWFAQPERILDDDTAPIYRWFRGGRLNTCFNALDRHVIRGAADADALIFHSAITGRRRTYSYAELLERVAQFGGALQQLGVEAGDRVIIYMPMVPEAVIAMLACARIGAVHSVVFGGLRAGRAGQPDRRRAAEGDRLGLVRPRGRQGDRVPADGRGRPGPDRAPARPLRRLPARAS